MAFGAIDIAVWDAASRARGLPIATLLGEALRERVDAYVSGPFLKPGLDPYWDFDADIDAYLRAGFRVVGRRSLDGRRRRVTRVRGSLHPRYAQRA